MPTVKEKMAYIYS